MAFFDHPLPGQSSSSLDLNDLLAYEDVKGPCLLSETLSQDSLSTSSSGTPLFPSEYVAPGFSLAMCPRGLPRVGGVCTANVMAKAILTVPTAPRLRTMSKESLCIRKWAECLVVADAPGHIPWGDLGESPSLSWIPEGSSYPPEAFREALLSARLPRDVRAQKPYIATRTDSEELPLAPNHGQALHYPSSESFRKGLVFEREIAFGSADKRRRWSLQVPAAAMNPEMVDMMLELRDLNTFFKGGMHDLDQSATLFEEEKDKLLPPSLVVSSSSCTLPISLDSSGNLTSEIPLPLAARRGKKMPAALSFRKGTGEFEYPDIPTAFLGSPSAYSPKTEFANQTDGPSMDLEEMVASLRASVPGRSPCVIEAFETDLMERHLNPSNFASASVRGGNGWAFADDLLQCYGDQMPSLDSISTSKFRQSILLPSRKGLLPQSLGDFESNSSASVSDVNHDTDEDSIRVSNGWDVRRPQSVLSSPRVLAPMPVLATRPPSTPLPPRPALTSPSSPKRVVGILKSRKSVRFASLPSRRGVPSPAPESLSTERGNKLRTPSVASLRRPSPLRNSFAPSTATNSPTTPIQMRVAHPTSKTISRVAGRKGTPVSAGASRLISKPLSALKPVPTANKLPICSPLACSNSTKQGVTPSKKFVWNTTSSLERHSLGGLGRDITASGVENRVASSCRSAPSRWSTLNENMRRRGSGMSLKDSSTQKSRMRAPLRNIFTRFK